MTQETNQSLERVFEEGDDDGLAWEAAKELTRRGAASATPTLVRVLKHGNPTRRSTAAWALGWVGSRIAIAPLRDAALNPDLDVDVRGHAIEAFGAMAQRGLRSWVRPIVSNLITLIGDDSPELRYWAAYALGSIGDPASVPALERMAATDTAVLPHDRSLAQEALDALAAIRMHAIADAFTSEPATPVPASRVREWLTSDDPEILGAMFHYLTEPARARRVEPALSFMEYQDFVFRYGALCLRRSEEGEFADSRYSFGYALIGWIVGLWDGSDRDRQFVRVWKEWLARQYKDGDEDIRRCLVDATLEHLFEYRALRTFFADWKDDTSLAVAYEEADAWRRHGGRTPLIPDSARE